MAFDCYKHHNLLRESKMHLLYIYSLLAMMVSNLKNGLSALFSARGLLPANVTQIFLMIPMIRMPLFPLLQLRDLPYKYLIIYLGFFGISRSLTFFQILWENYGFITIMWMLQFVQLKFKFHIHGTFYH